MPDPKRPVSDAKLKNAVFRAKLRRQAAEEALQESFAKGALTPEGPIDWKWNPDFRGMRPTQQGRQVGHLRLKGFNMPEPIEGIPIEKAWYSELDYRLRGQGHGKEMYRQAIENLKRDHPGGFVFAPAHLPAGPTAGTEAKPAAMRVWKSLAKEYPTDSSGMLYIGPEDRMPSTFSTPTQLLEESIPPTGARAMATPLQKQLSDLFTLHDEQAAEVRRLRSELANLSPEDRRGYLSRQGDLEYDLEHAQKDLAKTQERLRASYASAQEGRARSFRELEERYASTVAEPFIEEEVFGHEMETRRQEGQLRRGERAAGGRAARAARPSLGDLLQSEGIPRESFIDFVETPENRRSGKSVPQLIQDYKIAGELPGSAGVPEGRFAARVPVEGLSSDPILQSGTYTDEFGETVRRPTSLTVSPTSDQRALSALDPESGLNIFTPTEVEAQWEGRPLSDDDLLRRGIDPQSPTGPQDEWNLMYGGDEGFNDPEFLRSGTKYPDYDYYVYDRETGGVLSGWEFAEDAQDALEEIEELYPDRTRLGSARAYKQKFGRIPSQSDWVEGSAVEHLEKTPSRYGWKRDDVDDMLSRGMAPEIVDIDALPIPEGRGDLEGLTIRDGELYTPEGKRKMILEGGNAKMTQAEFEALNAEPESKWDRDQRNRKFMLLEDERRRARGMPDDERRGARGVPDDDPVAKVTARIREREMAAAMSDPFEPEKLARVIHPADQQRARVDVKKLAAQMSEAQKEHFRKQSKRVSEAIINLRKVEQTEGVVTKLAKLRAAAAKAVPVLVALGDAAFVAELGWNIYKEDSIGGGVASTAATGVEGMGMIAQAPAALASLLPSHEERQEKGLLTSPEVAAEGLAAVGRGVSSTMKPYRRMRSREDRRAHYERQKAFYRELDPDRSESEIRQMAMRDVSGESTQEAIDDLQRSAANWTPQRRPGEEQEQMYNDYLVQQGYLKRGTGRYEGSLLRGPRTRKEGGYPTMSEFKDQQALSDGFPAQSGMLYEGMRPESQRDLWETRRERQLGSQDTQMGQFLEGLVDPERAGPVDRTATFKRRSLYPEGAGLATELITPKRR